MTDDVISLEARRRQEFERRQQRLELSWRNPTALAGLQAPVTEEELTGNEVAEYFGVSRSTLIAITRRYGAELREVGYKAGGGQGHPSIYSKRAIIHLGLLMRPTTSKRAQQIQEALGQFRAGPFKNSDTPSRSHRERCRKLLEQALGFAEAAQEQHAPDVWADLTEVDRYELQAMFVALSALLPLDQPGLRRYLTELSLPHIVKSSGDCAMGLALLVPPKETAWELVAAND